MTVKLPTEKPVSVYDWAKNKKETFNLIEKKLKTYKMPPSARRALLDMIVSGYRAGYRGKALEKYVREGLIDLFPEIEWDKWIPVLWDIIKFILPLLIFLLL